MLYVRENKRTKDQLHDSKPKKKESPLKSISADRG